MHTHLYSGLNFAITQNSSLFVFGVANLLVLPTPTTVIVNMPPSKTPGSGRFFLKLSIRRGVLAGEVKFA